MAVGSVGLVTASVLKKLLGQNLFSAFKKTHLNIRDLSSFNMLKMTLSFECVFMYEIM